jgi:hypothetical protein
MPALLSGGAPKRRVQHATRLMRRMNDLSDLFGYVSLCGALALARCCFLGSYPDVDKGTAQFTVRLNEI